jgi:flagellar hook-associated protein 2
MSIDITSIYNSSTSIDSIVEQYMALEERPVVELEDKKEDLYTKKNVLTTLHSKLSSLKTAAEQLSDPLTDYFAAKNARSSDAEKFLVSATTNAELGNHSLTVERLAQADTRVSKQYTDSNTSFNSFTTDQTFSIEVGHPLDEDPYNRVSINVTISADSFSQTDDAVLADITDAVNLAMGNAVIAGTITSTERIQASIVTEQTGVSRLVFRSMSSGYDYRQDMTDSTDSLLAALEINQNVQSSGSSGGYMTEIGTSATDSSLNSKFLLDGLIFYRNSNMISDALTGVTLELLDSFETTENITINADTASVKEEVRTFLDSYNELMQYVRDNTGINSETGTSGLLSLDSKYMDMKSSLRTITLSQVEGVLNSDYSSLFTIGIEANSIGMLSIKDASKFTEALEASTTNVSDIFKTSENGIIDQLIDYIEKFIGADGKIFDSKSIIDEQVSYLDDRIDNLDTYLQQRETQLREQFSQLQQAIALLSSQQSILQSYTS